MVFKVLILGVLVLDCIVDISYVSFLSLLLQIGEERGYWTLVVDWVQLVIKQEYILHNIRLTLNLRLNRLLLRILDDILTWFSQCCHRSKEQRQWLSEHVVPVHSVSVEDGLTPSHLICELLVVALVSDKSGVLSAGDVLLTLPLEASSFQELLEVLVLALLSAFFERVLEEVNLDGAAVRVLPDVLQSHVKDGILLLLEEGRDVMNDDLDI